MNKINVKKIKVTYIVATGKIASQCYRMHIVAPFLKKEKGNKMILCHMLQIDPVDSCIDLEGKKRKKIQKPIQQLNLMNELKRKIDSNYYSLGNNDVNLSKNEELMSGFNPKAKDSELEKISKKMKSFCLFFLFKF